MLAPTLRPAAPLVVDRDRCLYCGACVGACPPDALYLRNGALSIDDPACTRCGRCIRVCPVAALSLSAAAPSHAARG